MTEFARVPQPACQSLESRRLLAAANGYASLRDGFIRIFGTSSADQVRVTVENNTVKTDIDGNQQSFPLDQVHQVYVWGYDGDDHINEAGLPLPTMIYGGDGNDWIVGGHDGYIDGGAGSDHIVIGKGGFEVGGNDGVDYISGVDANDEIYYGNYEDYIDGGRDQVSTPTLRDGVVHIDGTPAPDRISIYNVGNDLYITVDDVHTRLDDAAHAPIWVNAGAGDDSVDEHWLNRATTVYGGDGDDSITGGSGADRIYGGAGNDELNGLGGRDLLYGQDGADTLRGGDGRDYLDGGADADTLRGDHGVDRVIVRPFDRVFNQHDSIEQIDL